MLACGTVPYTVLTMAMKQGMGSQGISRKSAEAFVRWNEPSNARGPGRNSLPLSTKSGGKGIQPTVSNSCASNIVQTGVALLSKNIMPRTGGVCIGRGPGLGDGRRSMPSAENVNNGGAGTLTRGHEGDVK